MLRRPSDRPCCASTVPMLILTLLPLLLALLFTLYLLTLLLALMALLADWESGARALCRE